MLGRISPMISCAATSESAALCWAEVLVSRDGGNQRSVGTAVCSLSHPTVIAAATPDTTDGTKERCVTEAISFIARQRHSSHVPISGQAVTGRQ
jgi:hypothetical protein